MNLNKLGVLIMKRRIMICLAVSLLVFAVQASADLVVDLDAGDLALGDTRSWVNNGSVGGQFDLWEGDPNLVVEEIEGVRCVTFADNPDGGIPAHALVSSFGTPAGITGNNPYTIAVLAYQTNIANEECMLNWARRGASPRAAQFNYGTNGSYGATTHWGNPDLGWNPFPPAGQWHHLVVTYSGGTDGVETVYVNGISNNSEIKTLDLWPDGVIYIGCSIESDDVTRVLAYNGSLGYVKMYDLALTAAEIAGLAGKYVAAEITPEAVTVGEDGTTADFTIQVKAGPFGPPTQDISVTLPPVGDTLEVKLGDAAPGDPATVVSPAATWDTPQTLTVSTVDDEEVELVEVYTFDVALTSADTNYDDQIVRPPVLTVSIEDNEIRVMQITNGDFESGLIPGSGDFADVPGWVDSNADAFWSKPWIKDGAQPDAGGSASHNGTAVVLMSAQSAGPAIDGAGLLGYVYQNIGTADGALEVKIGFETGIPLDGPGELPGRDYGVTWTILQTDGSFVPGDELDILGAAGVTVIDQQTLLYTGKIVGDVETEEWTFDLSSADTSDLYLRFNTYSGVNNDPWIGLDNVAIGIKTSVGRISGDVTVLEIGETSDVVDVQLDRAPLKDVTVQLTAAGIGDNPLSDANDIRINDSDPGEPALLTFTPENWEQIRTVTVTAVDDGEDEGTQMLTIMGTVVIGDPNTSDPNFIGGWLVADAVVTVLDNQPGFVVFETDDSTEVTENGGLDDFTVALMAPPLGEVTVSLADSSDPLQVVVSPAELTFSADDYDQAKPVTVEAINDDVSEDDPHGTTIRLTASSGTDAGYDGLEATVEVSIAENDCGAWGTYWADFNGDCIVGIADLEELAFSWLACTTPNEPGCVDMR